MILSEKNDLNQEVISISSNNENEFQELDNEIERLVRGEITFEGEEVDENCNELNNSLKTNESSNENNKKNFSKNNNKKAMINNKINNDSSQNNTNSLNISKNLINPHLMNSKIKNLNNNDFFKDYFKSFELNKINNNINSESKNIQVHNIKPNNRINNENIIKFDLNQNQNLNCFNLFMNCHNNKLKDFLSLYNKNNLNNYINNSQNLNKLNYINNVDNNFHKNNFGKVSNFNVKNVPLYINTNNDHFLTKSKEPNNYHNNIIINNKIINSININSQLINNNNISNQYLNFNNQCNQNNFNSFGFNTNINMNLSQNLNLNSVHNNINQIVANKEIYLAQQKQNQLNNNQNLIDLVLNHNINNVNNNKILNYIIKRNNKKQINNYNQKSFNNSNKRKICNPLPNSEREKNKINLIDVIQFKDKRTTLMIKNIPNKYTLSTFLDEINVYFKNTYDIFYLPIDYINKCNLGFAFINFVEPFHIILFYELYRGKKWKKFNSDKICELLYAKFQGRNELISHFEKGKVLSFDSENKRPLILPVPYPLPKINLPCYYLDLFIKLYPYVNYTINNTETCNNRSSSSLSNTFSINGNFILI
jgi:hypothetical protein